MWFTAVCVALCIPARAQENPGDISAQAKYIDADEIFAFVNGVAIIRKGSSTALIDTNANFIVPFNKYHFHGGSNNTYTSGQDGLIVADEGATEFSRPYAVLNLQGKKLYSSMNSFYRASDGYIETLEAPRTAVFINAQGKVIKATAPLTWNGVSAIRLTQTFANGLAMFFYADPHHVPSYETHKIYGYIDRTNKIVINPVFDYADDFSEGLAVVGKLNEFKEMKYGFIDTFGKVVIPLMYSKVPSHFKEGLALITPVDNREFSYAFINRQNEIVFKLPPNMSLRPDDFKDGYSVLSNSPLSDDKHYIDRTGKILNEKEMAVIRPARFPGVFSNNIKYDYDPFSQFTIAEKKINNKTIKGYINKDGVFKIVINDKTF